MTLIFKRCLPFMSLIILISGTALAQSELLTLDAAEQLALSDEPGILAAQARAESLREKSISAGALPDPQVRLGIMNLPTDSYDFNQEPMTQKQIGVQQMFPAMGSRRAMREQLESQRDALANTADARIRYVLREVREAYLETYYWRRAKRIVSDNRDLFSQLVMVTRSLYSVGQRNQQDMVRAELELSRLDDRLFQINEQIQRSQAALAQWIGSNAATQAQPDDLPLLKNYADVGLLKARLLEHPLLLAANAQIASADSGKDLANSKYRPKIGVELTYGWREDDRFGNPRDNFVSAIVMLSVPLFTGNRQDKDSSSAEYARAASLNDRDTLLRALTQKLESNFARWQQLLFRIGLYDETIIKQSRLQAQSTLQAYQNNTTDFADVMRATIADLNTQLDFIRLQTDRAKTFAQLDYLVGDMPQYFNGDPNNE